MPWLPGRRRPDAQRPSRASGRTRLHGANALVPHGRDLGPRFGWFSNRLKGYPDTLNLKCQVHPRAGRQRPWIELEATDHPLALEQRNGITFDRLLEILALHGHRGIEHS